MHMVILRKLTNACSEKQLLINKKKVWYNMYTKIKLVNILRELS